MRNATKANLIRDTFNKFSGQNLDLLNEFYSNDVYFEDPVAQITGLDNLKKYYAHAYQRVKSISFNFERIIESDSFVSCEWTMSLAVRGFNGGRTYVVRGASHLEFNPVGKVISHKDYVDLGSMIYEQIPGFGMIIKKMRKLLKGEM